MDVRLDAGLHQDQRRLHLIGGYFAPPLSFAAGFGAVVGAGFELFLVVDVLEWWLLLLALVESCCGACGAT